MRRPFWLAGLVVRASLLAIVPVEAAGEATSLTTPSLPRINEVTSGALCVDAQCKVTATVTYNTGVSISGDTVPDFAIADMTLKTTCPIQAVTTVPPPAGALPPTTSNTLYLRTSCLVNAGDLLVVVYHHAPGAGYVFNPTYPGIHARSPQAFSWTAPAPVGS